MIVRVFVSCPTTLTSVQDAFHRGFVEALTRGGFAAHSVGRTDFGNSVPLVTIRRVMSACSGAAILGLGQLEVRSGVSRPATSRETSVSNLVLPTPWNHLETGIAFQSRLPLLVIREAGVADVGIFGLGVSDRFVHHADLSEHWLHSPAFTQPFEQWAEEVRAFAVSNPPGDSGLTVA